MAMYTCLKYYFIVIEKKFVRKKFTSLKKLLSFAFLLSYDALYNENNIDTYHLQSVIPNYLYIIYIY